MQNFYKATSIILVFFLFSCHSKKEIKQIPTSALSDSNEAQLFFPVTEYLLGQLNEIDSLPITPIKIINDGNKKDSIWLKRKDIRAFATAFLSPVIDSFTMKKLFTEKSFMDQTINSVTLTYDPIGKLPDSLTLKHWDVYIDPQKNTVQRIYMIKEKEDGEVSNTTQLTWKANEWCSIRTIRQEPNKEPIVHEETVKWDLDD